MACLSISLHSRKMQVRAKRGGKAGQCLDQGRCRADACLSYTLAWMHTTHCEEKTGPGKQRHLAKVTQSHLFTAMCGSLLPGAGIYRGRQTGLWWEEMETTAWVVGPSSRLLWGHPGEPRSRLRAPRGPEGCGVSQQYGL